jgi:hypothetical protein
VVLMIDNRNVRKYKGKNRLEDTSVDRKIMLKCIFNKSDGRT